MSIKSLCKTEVVTIKKKSSLKEASELMHKQHVGSLVVVEAFNGKRIPCGIITDRDIALTVGSASKPQELGVDQIMQSQPITAHMTDGLYETITKMRTYGVKRLPVVDDFGSLFGLISTDDILSLMGEEINNLAKVTETQVKVEQGIRIPTEKRVQL